MCEKLVAQFFIVFTKVSNHFKDVIEQQLKVFRWIRFENISKLIEKVFNIVCILFKLYSEFINIFFKKPALNQIVLEVTNEAVLVVFQQEDIFAKWFAHDLVGRLFRLRIDEFWVHQVLEILFLLSSKYIFADMVLDLLKPALSVFVRLNSRKIFVVVVAQDTFFQYQGESGIACLVNT